MIFLPRLLSLALLASLWACADAQTISRRTWLPAHGTSGVAIHLDAQQRLVLIGPNGEFCAEASPDALAAYASSLGLGVSAPSQGSASVAQALQGSSGSIGLRTQSITLMRDALYRVCEAYRNNQLTPVSATTLLARSQDLTAVVVAIEQLTGAVAANQVILTGTASASASANLLANQQLLDSATKDVADKEKTLKEAVTARDAQKKRVGDQQVAVATAEKNLSEATDANRAARQMELSAERDNLKQEQSKLEDAENEVKLREKLLANSKQVVEAVQDSRSAALTQATAATTSAGQFSMPVQRKELSSEATKEIAQAVDHMVSKVLDKPYVLETCTTLLTRTPKNEEPPVEGSVKDACLALMTAKIESETRQLATFGFDDTSQRIQSAIKSNPALAAKLNQWLAKNAGGISATLLIYGAQYADLRRRAITEVPMP